MKYSKKQNVLKAVILFFIITLVIIAIKKLVPQSKAEETNSTVTVTFTSGDYNAFDNKTIVLTKDTNNRIILPDTFSSTVDVTVTENNKVDVETFYFDDNWQTDEEIYAYSFTGWHIVETSTFIPESTVFQPQDYIDLNKVSVINNQITLEAVWGKVYFIRNPYETMVYKANEETSFYELDTENSLDLTGANDTNKGNRENAPFATIDAIYENLRNDISLSEEDAFHTVIMLTGDLDYYKNSADKNTSSYYGYGQSYTASTPTAKTVIPRSVTYKSLQKTEGTVYNYNYKPKGYYNQIYGSMRFDNVNFKPAKKGTFGSQTIGTEFELMSRDSTNKNYFELTARFKGTFSTFRTSKTSVVVVKGGTITGGWQFNYSSSDTNGTKRNWYIGRNANITGNIHLGVTSSNISNVATVKGEVNLTVTGGYIKAIHGGNNGINTINVGDRNITIIGDSSGNRTSDPEIANIYGGAAQGRLFGNVTINIRNCTKITNVYGGGKDFSATTYGNINVNVFNSMISGNIYGGGYNANTEKITPEYTEYKYSNMALSNSIQQINRLNFGNYSLNVDNGGDVSINLNNSIVKGNIFGSGQGSSQILSASVETATSYTKDWYPQVGEGTIYPENWDVPLDDYPYFDTETGQVIIAKYKAVSWVDLNPTNITFQHYGIRAYLSLATVINVDITVDSSTIGTSGGTAGNIYGGGSIAKVLGNTNIIVKGCSTIYGNVYGGGDGVTKPGTVKVYKPLEQANYVAPTYKITALKGSGDNIIPTVTKTEQSPKYTTNGYGEFSWSSDKTLLENEDTPGIDLDKKLLYSPNTEGLGSVLGNTNVTISDTSVIKGSVYGGGNAGIVYGTTTVDITGGTVKKSIFGGGYSGNVEKNTTIIIHQGTFENIFGGGDQGYVTGNTTVYVGDANDKGIIVTGLVYGGGRGYDADGDGDASDFTTVKGASEVIIQGTKTNVENYGSIKLGAVAGDVNVKFTDYWTGNATSKYKTMNGIDRATTVTFNNSYVLLENKTTVTDNERKCNNKIRRNKGN